MAIPDIYAPAHEFLTDEVAAPSFPGSELDIELAAIQAIFAQYRTNLALLQRSDGRLKNGIVTTDSLDTVLAAAIGDLDSIDDVQAMLDAVAADLVLTHADVVLTHADVVLTHADVVLTHADVVLTHADVIAAAASAALAATFTGDMEKADNLSGLANYATARTNMGLGTGDSPQFTAVNIGAASDTTLTRTGAGDIAVEGNGVYRAGGTDVALADGGTGASLVDPNADRIGFWDDSAGGFTWLSLRAGLLIIGTELVAEEVHGIALSDEGTAITTGTNKATFSLPYAFTVTGVYATINTVSSLGTPTVDINEAGTTILSTKIVIDVSEKTGGSAGYQGTAAGAAVISDAAIAANAEIGFDIDVAGTGAKGLKAYVIGYRT